MLLCARQRPRETTHISSFGSFTATHFQGSFPLRKGFLAIRCASVSRSFSLKHISRQSSARGAAPAPIRSNYLPSATLHYSSCMENTDGTQGTPIVGEPGAAAAASSTPATEVATAGLSKTALKKQLKYQQKSAAKAAKKAQRKEEQKLKTEQRREESQARFEKMTEEEKAKHLERRNEIISERKRALEQRREKRRKALETGQGLLLALEFFDKMTDKESKSLASQLSFCYASNTRAEVPCRLILTGLSGGMGALWKGVTGSDKWQVVAEERNYIEAFAERKEELVYLTADSDNIIEEIDPTKTYIIGGIVDHNRYRNLTLDKANEQGIAHGALPIGAHLKMDGSCVLTVNQVVDIFLNYLDLKDWEKALTKAIPARKRKRGDDDEEDEEGEDDEDKGEEG
ncbi:hypothetical protein CYMTET_35238 [Cymbomonas tetramitiformis]|uniref:tRNA (guanine(9)-N(1))-methyltransferase n=1 Tax=Cymbomonas tetramitiformis TaxID=36881 RepID=A0AAE0F9K5_9CHLO|nr:hypothetical protein CYMTET_35238 [Cymbomonas tetramitiformis]